MAIGNTLEALFGAYLLNRFFSFHTAMDRIQDVVGLAIVSLFATTVSATIGTGTLVLTGMSGPDNIAAIWLTWWIGDLLGALVVAPALLVWFTRATLRLTNRLRLEGVALFSLLGLVTWYVFSNRPAVNIYNQALIYLVFPFIIWAALRFGQRGAATAVILVSGIAIWGTVQGVGPFSLQSKNDSLVLLQTFSAVVSLTALILAAATTERRRATEALRQRADELATLNESSKTFLDNADIPNIYNAICQLAVNRLGLDAAWIETDGLGNSGANLTAAHGIPVEELPKLRSIWDHDGLRDDLTKVQVKSIDNLAQSGLPSSPGHQSYAAIPLMVSSEPIGVLKLLSNKDDFFTQDRQLLIQSYANLAAVVIQNSWLFEEVRKSNRQLHALSQRLIQAQEQERLHLSRELHDESGQLLAGLLVQLGLLERESEQEGLAQERISELKNTTSDLQNNLHQLAVNLRPASLDHLGLVTALEQYVNDFGQQYNIQVEFEAVGIQKERLPNDMETALFRIVQESLTNVILHAQATHVDVVISRRSGHVAATIEDNGVGFMPTTPNYENQLGLFGMRERVEMLGGRFTIESSPEVGTTVNVEVPYNA
jgi:signal transduction histidine kinase